MNIADQVANLQPVLRQELQQAAQWDCERHTGALWDSCIYFRGVHEQEMRGLQHVPGLAPAEPQFGLVFLHLVFLLWFHTTVLLEWTKIRLFWSHQIWMEDQHKKRLQATQQRFFTNTGKGEER